MLLRRSPSYSDYSDLPLEKVPHRRLSRRLLVVLMLLLLLTLAACSLYLRSISRSMAISDAKDAVNLAVNNCVNRIMRENDYDNSYFITLEKDSEGNISAITTNTAHINELSSRLMTEIADAANSEMLNLRIPLGSLLGSNLLMGRGPDVPVEVIMLTSSFVRFDNELISTGINQSRHVITLKADVDIDILIPWSTISTTVETDVLIAETVIVGRVPHTYLSLTEDNDGSK